jgi:CubicO group peptidase (beta-lactamase class C family)
VSTPERLGSKLDQLLAGAQREKRLPSIAGAVLRDGEIVWESAVGMADVEGGLEATPDTQYRLGSITKTFTAAAMMQLRDAGKLDLEDTLDMHVEGAAHRPTIRRLLSHASGLQRETHDDSWLTLRFARPDELLETLQKAEMVLPSGARFHYSNLAFALLGIVVERVSGMSYMDYVREWLFEPVGLTPTVSGTRYTSRRAPGPPPASSGERSAICAVGARSSPIRTKRCSRRRAPRRCAPCR